MWRAALFFTPTPTTHAFAFPVCLPRTNQACRFALFFLALQFQTVFTSKPPNHGFVRQRILVAGRGGGRTGLLTGLGPWRLYKRAGGADDDDGCATATAAAAHTAAAGLERRKSSNGEESINIFLGDHTYASLSSFPLWFFFFWVPQTR